MDRLARWVTARRRLVVLLWAVVFLAGGFASSTISHHLNQRFDMPGQAAYEANQTIQQLYGNGGGSAPLVVAVTAPAGSHVDDPAAAGVLQATADGLAAIPGARVASPTDPGGAALVSADHTTAAVLVFGRTGVGAEGPDVSGEVAAARAVLDRTLPPGWQGGVTGEDAIAQGGGSQAGNGVLTEALLGALGALAVLAFVFGSLLALMPLIIAAVSVLASFLMVLGVTYLTDVSFIVQFLIGVIGLGVAIDYSLLMVTRWREERTRGADNTAAIATAMATAGRAVAFSGVTVAIGLVALVVLPLPFMRSIGIGGMLIPLVSVVASLTLLPALLAMAGPRMDWPWRRRDATASRGWTAWARLVVRRRWVAAAVSLAAVVGLGVAGLGMHVGEPPAATQARSGSAFAGLTQLADHGLAGGVLTPVEVLVPAGTDPGAVTRGLGSTAGVRAVLTPEGAAWHRGGGSMVSVVPRDEAYTSMGGSQAGAIRDVVDAQVPGAAVGGVGPAQIDAVRAIYGRFPVMLGIIAVVTFLLLVRAFRSVLLPLKAVLLNLLSVGAAYGVLRLVWQDGHGSAQIWGTPATGAITFWVPLMVFAFLYGLSMDYEVFILARMREEYDRSGSTPVAVTEGLGRTGRLVTSAALILFLTFASLASAPVTDLRIFATGLGAGILLDATVVRALLVPALVSLFGRWNWWLPGWVAWFLRVPPSPARAEAPVHPQAAQPSATKR